MPFKRYVKIGRVALVNYGKDYGRPRSLVDAPRYGEEPNEFQETLVNVISRLTLVEYQKEVSRLRPWRPEFYHVLLDVKNKWEKSSPSGKLIVRKRRASLNDFDRFKLMVAKIKDIFVFLGRFVHLQKSRSGR
ncbi:hypothetical protein IFM89_032566 [Coptis chinensis]|uniref:Large ribosomal subunit protein eL14 domain-containing protein n=1 Tax=Coptis chinensis TaxID=261450 RepID=A0A835I4L6_9MAGN|nr:hypothetical protein IFM89_032566 [Coptis chinensis]